MVAMDSMGVVSTYPIVLCHGLARFDAVTNLLWGLDNRASRDGFHYFRNIRTHLMREGFNVHHANVDWARGLDVRARSLKRVIEGVLERCSADQVHLIAHSMGGLDARHMLYLHREQGFHERVASVTTIGTPHWGSPVADVLVKAMALRRIGRSLRIEGVVDLTTGACAAFNELAGQWEETCGVRFRAIAGRQRFRQTFALLKPTWLIVRSREGENDGLVSVSSARWRDEWAVEPLIDADHLNLLGWWEPAELWRGVWPGALANKIKKLYLDIAVELAAAFSTSERKQRVVT